MEDIGNREYSPERFDSNLGGGGPGAAEFAPFYARLGGAPIFVPRITSTNDLLKARLKAGEHLPAFLACDSQTGGRGTGGRNWMDASGKDVLFSVAVNVENFPKLRLLSIAVGACVAINLRDVAGLDICVKWPNDLTIAGRKLGGILIDLLAEKYAIIGIGINVRSKPDDFIKPVREISTSIAFETESELESPIFDHEFGIARLPVLIAAAGGAVRAAAATDDSALGSIIDKFKKLDRTPGTIRSLTVEGKSVTAECLSVDLDTGELLARLPDGKTVRVTSASGVEDERKLL